MTKAVFLDRDGVLNDAIVRDGKPYPPNKLDEFKIAKGAEEACRLLLDAGFELVVVTNQPDISRGITSKQMVESFHAVIASKLSIKHIYTCFHDDADVCICRKPKPGLILDAASKLGLQLAESFLVGDRWKDIEAGKAAGCKTIFVDHAYSEKKPENPYSRVSSLLEGARIIIGDHK